MPGLPSPVLSALFALLVLASAGPALADEDKKRRAPAEVPPVVVDGIRYEAPLLGQPYGYAQDGGIVIARHAASGALQWTRLVYTVKRDPRIESDKQDIFIKTLQLSADRRRLVIANEHGQTFELNLDGSRVRTSR